MRLPRDISGEDLARRLSRYGYRITRQTGSHLRLTTELKGEHHLTIHNHKDLRIGTIAAILADVADHLAISKDELVQSHFN